MPEVLTQNVMNHADQYYEDLLADGADKSTAKELTITALTDALNQFKEEN